MTRMRMSALRGGKQLCVDYGLGTPTHIRVVEEILEVIDGVAEMWLEEEEMIVRSSQSILIPAGAEPIFATRPFTCARFSLRVLG